MIVNSPQTGVNRPTTPHSSAAARHPPVGQVFPARVVSDLTRSMLAQTRAQGEAADDVMLGLGYRLRTAQQGGARSERGGPQMSRRALAGIASSLGSGVDSRLQELIEEVSQMSNFEDVLSRLATTDLPSGATALVLAALLGRSTSHSDRRRRLGQMLDEVLLEDGWQLDLLGWIEFGSGMRSALPDLRALYQSVHQPEKSLSAWFQELRTLTDRRRKLRVLIRSLGLSLSSEGAVLEGEHLASVVTDLKRLLIFFGMEEQCAQLADLAVDPQPSTDDVLAMLLALIEETWIYEQWFHEHFRSLGVFKIRRRFARGLMKLMQALPEPCYREDGQREQILEAIQPIVDDDSLDGAEEKGKAL